LYGKLFVHEFETWDSTVYWLGCGLVDQGTVVQLLACRGKIFLFSGVSRPMISGSLSPCHGASLGCRWRNGL